MTPDCSMRRRPGRAARRIRELFLWIALMAALSGCGPSGGGSAAGAGATRGAYPARQVSIVCPWAPGGGSDRLARFFADQLQISLGQPVIVVNKTGGGGAIGHTDGARARPDGHTLTLATFELSTMRAMGISEVTWRDFVPVALLNGDAAAVIVRKEAPWNSISALLDQARAQPGKIKMSGTASGGAWDLARAGLLLKAGLKLDAVTWVPAQGSAPSLVELLGGHIDAVCCSLPEAATQLESGQVRALVVMAPARVSGFESVPTARESGIDWEAVGWRGVCVPKGTPADIVDRLTGECRRIQEGEAYREFLRKNRFGPRTALGSDFARFLEVEEARWQPVIEACGLARK
jgi:tripartite-type tricarboxylate transporter receptor subunit TctC